MGKHRDIAEKAALDLATHSLVTFLGKAGLRDRANASLTPEQSELLDVAARRHERREKNR
ncbi:hypothetical protein GCM10010168_15250 [Actinoplanes ianthinogenes]|uniref:Uncharacterized protein n=1 Tax=Actinoplanes ianthinogenes TaxID=122358 RepID=A0ABM7LZF7_9ACTN|nr:hypothetical protein [Actinoplanes ianthinogenes]BCJ44712.1 hypothetical protein Aiant_53690 [Actinoplanes ianthinogenes]GGQ99536.1 hypothetical protein GCM10010168_15250 [Actinoplanes ianthinogenes]